MKTRISLDYYRESAETTLKQIDAAQQMLELDLPGVFVFSPPVNRITVDNMADLHAVRAILREKYGWTDELQSKFYSCGDIIVIFRPPNYDNLPVPFDLWVEAPPESFPAELLGDCKLEPRTSTEYDIVCPMKGE